MRICHAFDFYIRDAVQAIWGNIWSYKDLRWLTDRRISVFSFRDRSVTNSPMEGSSDSSDVIEEISSDRDLNQVFRFGVQIVHLPTALQCEWHLSTSNISFQTNKNNCKRNAVAKYATFDDDLLYRRNVLGYLLHYSLHDDDPLHPRLG